MNAKTLFVLIAVVMTTGMTGCGDHEGGASRNADKAEANKIVVQKFGKSLDELPVQKLVIISPHNVDIEKEYESAFSLYHAENFGERVDMEWRDVGGGASSILHHLKNVYAGSGSSDMDIVWGGGEYNFQIMAKEGILEKMEISRDILAHIPTHLGGIAMVDKDLFWCGSAVSGFGFLFNKSLLDRMKLPYPEKWEDLAAYHFMDLLGLADPTQSGSAAASYEMIVQSGGDWPAGWAKLLSILGNAKKFYAGAGDAAEAIPSGEVAVATCIDFYGINRVAKYPDTLVYVSPGGQTSFNPDPIAILKNPPNPAVAQRLVEFVLSTQGQALWALPVGHPDGPKQFALGRQPIRKDVYEHYAGQLVSMIVNPYAAEQTMRIDQDLWGASFGLLRNIVYAAAVKNLDSLKAAKRKIMQNPGDHWRVEEFNRLPDNIATLDKLKQTDLLFADKKQQDMIVTGWITDFRDKYTKVSR
jgi:ABC-type Fe3+ transport system substrate-binding protein